MPKPMSSMPKSFTDAVQHRMANSGLSGCLPEQERVAMQHSECLALAVIEAIREQYTAVFIHPSTCPKCGSSRFSSKVTCESCCHQYDTLVSDRVEARNEPVVSRPAGLSFGEAILKVVGLDGKSMRRRGWERSVGFACYGFTQNDILATDWEITE